MRRLRGQSGTSLVETLVTLALLGIGITVIVNLISNVTRTRRAVELKAQSTLLKKNLLNSTNCKAISPCQGNQLRGLTDFDGAVLVNSSGTTRFGPYTVQARCQPDRSLEVRVALTDGKGPFGRDPLKNKPIDWQAPEGILIEKGVLCGILNIDYSVIQQFAVQTSLQCTPASGTCPPPAESAVDTLAPKKMCCEDGSNAVKPKCPGQTIEYASYWDRQDDWGASGQWVVLCL